MEPRGRRRNSVKHSEISSVGLPSKGGQRHPNEVPAGRRSPDISVLPRAPAVPPGATIRDLRISLDNFPWQRFVLVLLVVTSSQRPGPEGHYAYAVKLMTAQANF